MTGTTPGVGGSDDLDSEGHEDDFGSGPVRPKKAHTSTTEGAFEELRGKLLDTLESKLDRIERVLTEQSAGVRTELDRKNEQFAALSQQSLRVVELLNEARQEIERLKYSGGGS